FRSKAGNHRPRFPPGEFRSVGLTGIPPLLVNGLHGRLGMSSLLIFGTGFPFTIRLDSAALWADGPIPKTPPLVFMADERAIAANVVGMRTFNEMPDGTSDMTNPSPGPALA